MNLVMYRHPNSIIDTSGAGLYATLQLVQMGQGRSGYRVMVSVTGQNLPPEIFSRGENVNSPPGVNFLGKYLPL